MASFSSMYMPMDIGPFAGVGVAPFASVLGAGAASSKGISSNDGGALVSTLALALAEGSPLPSLRDN